MKTSRLLIAAVIMAGLGGFLWWSNKQEAAKEGQPAADAPPKIVSIKEDSLKQLEIKPREGEATVLARSSANTWQITAPKQLGADNAAVSAMLSSVADLSSDRVVDENPTDPASYGLNPAVVSVNFTMTDGKTKTLKFGEASPAGGNVYVMLDGDKRLFTAASSIKDGLSKTWRELRTKTLLPVDGNKVTKVEILPAGKPAVTLSRNEGQTEWQIAAAKPLRADGWPVEELMTRMQKVALNPEIDEKTAAAAFATAKPVATVKVTEAGTLRSIEIRKLKEEVYARSSALEGTFRVNNDAAEGLDKSLADFRAKKLFDFAFNDPNRIQSKALDVAKSGDKWIAGGKTMDSISVQNLIDKLRDLSASKFVDTGFTTPALEITVSSSEGKHVEKVQFSEVGDHFVARRENDTTLYQIEKDVINDLRASIDGVREPAPADAKKGDAKK